MRVGERNNDFGVVVWIILRSGLGGIRALGFGGAVGQNWNWKWNLK